MYNEKKALITFQFLWGQAKNDLGSSFPNYQAGEQYFKSLGSNAQGFALLKVGQNGQI